ncbi:MAG TPA: bacteriohemerythrin [Rectinemataceae bacterium]|nr:bacteriohemerythrin [Rectinemataceae bacterium]
MAFIEWSNSLSVGLAEIDDQHRRLIGLINRLSEVSEAGEAPASVSAALGELESYVATHFALEEGYFDRFQYPAAKEHKAEHLAFAQRVASLKAEFLAGKSGLSRELLPFLRSWLTNHIAFSDRKYKPLFAQKGVR